MTESRSRSKDPATSSEAARDIESSGVAHAQRALCLEAVRRKPGQTAAEIAVAVGLERHAPSRRLPELREAGLVTNGAPRTCAVMGRASITWYPRGETVKATEPRRPGVQGTLFEGTKR